MAFHPKILFSRFKFLSVLLIIASLAAAATAFMLFTQREVAQAMLEAGDEAACNVLRVIWLDLEAMQTDLQFFRQYAEARRKDQLRALGRVVMAQVEAFHQMAQRREIPTRKAQERALEMIKAVRYGHNDYFFVYDNRGVAVGHPDPAIQGRNMRAYLDEEGRPILKAVAEEIRHAEDGFSIMKWTRLGESRSSRKLLYFLYFKPWGWYLGTGVYLDDIDADVAVKKQEGLDLLRRTLHKVRISKTGYFTLFDSQKRILIHPFLENTDGSKLKNPVTGQPHLDQLMVASRTPDIPYKYRWDKPTAPGVYEYIKYAHVFHFAPFQWYIMSSVYEDEMRRPADVILKTQSFFLLGVVVLCAFFATLLVSRLTLPLARLDRHAQRLGQSDFTLAGREWEELATIRFPLEARGLAETFAAMEKRLKSYLEDTAARERLRSELQVARDIQMRMLPALPQSTGGPAGPDLAARVEPAQDVGGDLYDAFPLGGNRFGILIGDVSDKGVPAALFMARAKTLLRTAVVRHGDDPARALAAANAELVEGNDHCMFITAFVAIFDAWSGELTFANAGHLPPLLLGAETGVEPLRLPPGKPLGVSSNSVFKTAQVSLTAGDAVLAFTDGVTEAATHGGEFLGAKRLREALAGCPGPSLTATETVQAVFQAVADWVGAEPAHDDIAVICLRRRRSDETARQEWTNLGPDQLAAALDQVDALTDRAGVKRGPALEFHLVLEELLTNVFHHGGFGDESPTAGLRVEVVPGEARAEIRDKGFPFDPTAGPPGLPNKAERGRHLGGMGLPLVRKLTDDFHYRREQGENIIRLARRWAS